MSKKAMKVYKYRGGDESIFKRDLDSIRNNYFWAPTADKLNDPAESYVEQKDIQSFLQSLRAPDVESSFDNLLKMKDTVGVYSLSRSPLDELMWSYYANGHKGFCIEYDIERLTLEARAAWRVMEVQYRSTPQIIDMSDILSRENESSIMGKMICTKSERWAHEEEVRIITTSSGKNHYAPAALTGIYFGYRCPDEQIKGIRQQLAGKNIAYYKLKFSTSSYEMQAVPVEYNAEIDGLPIEYLAPIDEGAIPEIHWVPEEFRQYHPFLQKAIDRVRRDLSCVRVMLADFSTDKVEQGKPVIYVQYETNVPTQYYNVINQYYKISDLE